MNMPYVGSLLCVNSILLLVSILLPITVQAEPETPVLDITNQSIIADTTDVDTDMYEDIEDKLCPEDSSVETETDKPFFSFFDGPQEYISSNVESMARYMDDYFADSIESYDTSGSYLSLRQNSLIREGRVIDYSNKVKYRLRLPNTEKNFKLFFESSVEKKPYDISTEAEKTPINIVSDEGDYVIGIQADSGERYGWKYKPTLGADLNSNIDPFLRFRFSREYTLDKWSINWHETPYWHNSIGWGFDSYLEFNRKITENDLFRISTFAAWKEDTDLFELNHIYSMFHAIGKNKALSYYAGVYGISEPKIHTTQFLLGITYRQSIHKDYLFIEIQPQVLYQKINNFQPEHSLLFSLEMIFKK